VLFTLIQNFFFTKKFQRSKCVILAHIATSALPQRSGWKSRATTGIFDAISTLKRLNFIHMLIKFANFVRCKGLLLLCSLAAFAVSAADSPKENEPSAIQIAELNREKPIDFEREVLPLFKQNCLACHNASDAKGDLVLETPERILKGGETGPAVMPGKSLESLLLKVASHQMKPFMPPRNNKSGAVALKPDELGLIKLWIDQGATGVVSTALGPVHWQPLPAGLHSVNAVAVTRDGQFAACGRGNQIFIYRVPTGQLITRLTDPELIKSGYVSKPGVADRDIIQSLAFNPEGTVLASGAYRSLKLWQRQPSPTLMELSYAAAGAVEALAVSGDGKVIATGGADSSVKTWEAASGKLLHEFRGQTAPITSLAFSSDNQRLASASTDKTIRTWSVSNAEILNRFQTPGEVRSVIWAGEKLISGGGDNAIRVWQISASKNNIAELPQVIGAVAVTSDRKRIAVATDDNIQVIDAATGKTLKKVPDAKNATLLTFLNESNLLAGLKEKKLCLWDIEKSQMILETNLTNNIMAIARHPSAQQVAIALEGAALAIYSFSDNAFKQEKSFSIITNGFKRMAFNADASLLLGTADGKVTAVKVADGQAAFSITHEGGLRTFVIAPDSKTFATGGEKGDVRVWNLSDGSAVGNAITGFGSPVQVLSFSPDGKKLLAGTASGQLEVVDLALRSFEQSFSDFNGAVRFGEFLNDKQMFTVAAVNSLRLWDVATISSIAGHAHAVTSLALVPGGKQLLSGSKDGSVRLWDLEKNEQVRQMDQGGEVTAVAVRPDGKRIASAGTNNVVKLWNAEDGKLITEIKGDRQAQEFAQEMEGGFNFAKSETGHYKGALESAEKAEKAEAEALKKANEAKEKAEKAFAEKVEAHKKAEEAKATADKALADLKTAIQKGKDSKASLDESNQDLAAAAKALAEKAAQVQTEFAGASKAKESAYASLTEAAFQAKLASLAALEAKSKSEKETGNKELADARAQAEKAAAEKESALNEFIEKAGVTKSALDKIAALKAETDKALADAQSKAKSAVDVFSANEKLLADADKNQKEADEKIKNADKQLTEADKAMKQAEGVKNGAIQSVESTAAALKKAGEAILTAKANLKQAEESQAQAERTFETAKKSAAEMEKPIRALAFSPDNQLLLYAGEDGAVRSASAENGKSLDKFTGHTARTLALAFLPNGTFGSASADQTVRIWNPEVRWELSRAIGRGEESAPLVDRVMALDFSPDGKWLASGGGFPSRSGEMKIWNVADGSLVREFKDPHSDTVVALDFSPDQKFLASGGADKFLRVFDLETGKQIKAFEGHTHHVQGVSWERHGRTLASAGADKVVKVWDLASGEQRKTIEGQAKELTSIHFIGGSSEALVSAGDNRVRIIRDDGGEVRVFSGMNEFVSGADVTPDGKIVVAGSLDGVLRIWNGKNGETLYTFEPPKDEQPQQIAGKQ
jgi:WD40 repeat protein